MVNLHTSTSLIRITERDATHACAVTCLSERNRVIYHRNRVIFKTSCLNQQACPSETCKAGGQR